MSALPAHLVSPDQLPRDCVVVRKHNVVYLRPKSKTYGHRLVQYRNGRRVGVRHQYAWPRTMLPGFPVVSRKGVPVIPGSASFTSPGSTSWIAQAFNTLTADVRGGGGGGTGVDFDYYSGANAPTYGGAGGASSFNSSVVAYGGQPNGAAGGASGGDTNTAGGAGNGGAKTSAVAYGNNGGAGGRAVKTYLASSLVGSISVVVGAGGAGGPSSYPGNGGSPGGAGAVYLTWS